jgi:predicted DNA-binding transcriptional regulator AlpA
MNTGPSKLLPCPICKKEIRARGMDAHMRLMHGSRVKDFKAKERPTQLELGIGSVALPKSDYKGWKHKQKKRYRYTPQQSGDILGEMILTFGLAWLLSEISKAVNKQTAGKKVESFSANQHNVNLKHKG